MPRPEQGRHCRGDHGAEGVDHHVDPGGEHAQPEAERAERDQAAEHDDDEDSDDGPIEPIEPSEPVEGSEAHAATTAQVRLGRPWDHARSVYVRVKR